LNLPGVHVLVTDEVAGEPEFERRARDMQERCGASLALHLRLRRTPVRRRLALAESLEEGAVESDGWLVVNRRLDIALAVGADAVQLGRGSLPIAAVRDGSRGPTTSWPVRCTRATRTPARGRPDAS